MSTELHGLKRVAAAIRAEIQPDGKGKAPTPKPASRPATNSELAEFEPELRRVLDKCHRGQQANAERLWRKSFDADPTNCLLMLRSVK
jgi:hypothetical protein